MDLPHRPASAEPPSVEVCDDTTQCNSTNNGEVLTRPERARIRKRFRRRKPFCLRATLANFSIFCRQTSLHGWQYIAQRNSSSAKHMFWAVVVSLSMATAAMFLYNNTMDYLNATVSTYILTQWARKFKKVQAKKLIKSNKSKTNFVKLHFWQF